MSTPDLDFCWYFMCRLLHLDPARYNWRSDGRDDGMTTTEVAVITFLLVVMAIGVVAVIANAARDNANNIPVPEG